MDHARWRLIIRDPDRTSRRFDVRSEVCVVGRSARCDLRLNDPTASSEHARLLQVGEELVVEDLGSTNGIVTRAGELSRGMRMVLQAGDVLGLGRTVIEVLGREGELLHDERPPIELLLPGDDGRESSGDLRRPAGRPGDSLATPWSPLGPAADAPVPTIHSDGETFIERRPDGVGTSAAARLTFVSRAAKGIVDISTTPFRIGRSPRADIALVVRHERVSNPHVEFRIEEGRHYVVDLGSLNGTWINGKRLSPNVPEPLAPEAIVRLGPIAVLFSAVVEDAVSERLAEQAAELLLQEGVLRTEDIERARARRSRHRSLGELLLVDARSNLTIDRWRHAVDRARASDSAIRKLPSSSAAVEPPRSRLRALWARLTGRSAGSRGDASAQ